MVNNIMIGKVMESIVIGFTWFAVCLYFISGFFRTPKITLSIALAGNVFFIIKYVYMGEYAPGIAMSFNTVSALIMLMVTKDKKIYIALPTFLISSIFIAQNFTGVMDLLIVTAAGFLLMGQVNLDNYIRYKASVMASQICWVVFSFAIHDFAMITTCCFILYSNGFSLFRNMRVDVNNGMLYINPYFEYILLTHVKHLRLPTLQTQTRVPGQFEAAE
jgi:hypothetical protein